MVSSSLIIIDQHWSQLIIVLMLIIIDQPLPSSMSIDKNRSSLTVIDKYHCLWLITIEQILITTDHHWSPLIIVILVAFRIASLIPCDSALFVHGSGCSCSKSREIRDWAWGQKQSARSRKARGASEIALATHHWRFRRRNHCNLSCLILLSLFFHCFVFKCSKEEQELVVRPPWRVYWKNLSSTCWYVRCLDESVRHGITWQEWKVSASDAWTLSSCLPQEVFDQSDTVEGLEMVGRG